MCIPFIFDLLLLLFTVVFLYFFYFIFFISICYFDVVWPILEIISVLELYFIFFLFFICAYFSWLLFNNSDISVDVAEIWAWSAWHWSWCRSLPEFLLTSQNNNFFWGKLICLNVRLDHHAKEMQSRRSLWKWNEQIKFKFKPQLFIKNLKLILSSLLYWESSWQYSHPFR